MTMRALDTILYEEADGIAWVTLNRPQRRNAFTYPMCLELQEVWTTLRHRECARVSRNCWSMSPHSFGSNR
jgi:enoyl-CoA hydratase/carnithine racemase